MSGKFKKPTKTSSSHRANKNFGDVTLADFANAAIPSGSGRLKKATISGVVSDVKLLSIQDEKLKEEQDAEIDDVDLKKRSRRKKPVKEEIDRAGADYPLDIWFLISEYIRPEDVTTFACICRSTRHVVSTPKFWLNLYKRYYKYVPKMPERLKPECIVRHCGLRACVIRALYMMYIPFVTKAKTMICFEADPRQLTKRQCVLMWHEQIKNQWMFCFKLRNLDSLLRQNTVKKKPNLLEMLDDVSANSEEGCKVLQVTCINYIQTPMVLGQTLMSVSLTLDHAMRNKLQLVFGSGPRSVVDASASSIILNPVLKIAVLDWWHPYYPYPNKDHQFTAEPS